MRRESEMGDGEDIGSDLDGDEEEEEEEEDGGFVVPDGYGSDDCEGDVNQKNKKRKLEKVFIAATSGTVLCCCCLGIRACTQTPWTCPRLVCVCIVGVIAC